MTKLYSRLFLATCLLFVFKLNIRATVDISSTRVCFGDSTTFINISNIPQTAVIEWDLDNDGFFDDATGDTAYKLFLGADTFEIRLKITDSIGNEFFSSSPHLVIVDPTPISNFLIEGTCFNSSTVFTNSSTISDSSLLTYEWDFDNNGSVEFTTDNANRTFSSTGSFSISLKAISNRGCSSINIQNFSIHENPSVDFTFQTACAGTPTVFINQSTVGSGTLAQTVWNFDDGFLGFQTDTAFHIYQTDDTVSVKLKIINSNGCIDSVTKSLIILGSINFTFTFSNGQQIETGQSTDVELAGDFTSLVWNDNSSTDNPRTISSAGYFAFTLGNNAGCVKIDSFLIQHIEPGDITLMPANDFLTPNSDGINDLLFFKHINYYTNCSLKIYDTRGFEVFKSADYHNDWDATKSGKALNAGAYYYFLKCDNLDEFRGVTNIIK